MNGIWRLAAPLVLLCAIVLSGCFKMEAVYTFSSDGFVTVDATLAADPEVLEGLPEQEWRAFIEESLFSELGERQIVQEGPNLWRSTGPAVSIEEFVRFMRDQGTRVTESKAGYRFSSLPAETRKAVRSEIGKECAVDLPAEISPELCAVVSEMLVDPLSPVDSERLEGLVNPELGLSGEELAETIMLWREPIGDVWLSLELQGAVEDVVGFDAISGGGWIYESTLYEMLESELEWTVLLPEDSGAKSHAPRRGNAAREKAPTRVLPTPEVWELEDMSAELGSDVAYVLRASLGEGPDSIGVALTCSAGQRSLEVAAYFGGFPDDGRPVQLAVRDGEGRIERFGPVVMGTPRSGFHSPRIDERLNALRFAGAFLTEGALLSNGFRSVRNRVGKEANALAHRRLVECIEGKVESR